MIGTDLSSLCRDWRWFPEAIDQQGIVSFVRVNRQDLTEPTFLAKRWAPPEWDRAKARLRDVHGALPTDTPNPLHFIWSTAFCCSTAIARALDLPGHNLSLREPWILMALADVKRGAPPGTSFPTEPLDAVLRLLGRPAAAGEAVTVKPTNAANCFLPDVALLTSGKSLLLYCDCRSFLIATAKRRERGRAHHRSLFTLMVQDGHQHRWPPRKLFEMTDLQVSALVWHLQIAEYLRSAGRFAAGRIASLDCENYLDKPFETLSDLDKFFGLGLGVEYLRRAVDGEILGRHAKNAAMPFSVDQRRSENEDIAKSLGGELDEVLRWSYEDFGTPRQLPLPGLGAQ